MTEVGSFKMPFYSRQFNANQRVWIIWTTGDEAVYVYGRHRGSGRWIRAWVNWRAKGKPAPEIQRFEVSDSFADRIEGKSAASPLAT